MKLVTQLPFKLIVDMAGLLLFLSGCIVTATPTKPSTLFTNTPESRTPTCCEAWGDPPVCGLIPGESTMEDVRKNIWEEPMFIEHPSPDIVFNGGVYAETKWSYGRECPLSVYFNDDIVYAIQYSLNEKMCLADVVARHGVPDWVRPISIRYPLESPETEYWGVDFIWLDEGMIWSGDFLDQQPLDPVIVEQDTLSPFDRNLDVSFVTYFYPAPLEDLKTIKDSDDPLVSWPGMTEK